jgi:enediyne biosynthesis protein E4
VIPSPSRTAGSRVRARAVIAGIGAAIVVLLGAVAALTLMAPASPGPGPAPRFDDVTATSGVGHRYGGPFVFAVGGGVAVFDCNADHRPDLLLAGGEHPAALYRNESTAGTIRFAPVTDPAVEIGEVNGAYALDIDSDGLPDLVLLRRGENVVLRNRGDCAFERANEAWNLDGGGELTEAFSATWEPGAAWPTLAFGNYADPDSDDFATWCQPNELVRPRATGRGYGTVTELLPSFCSLSMLFTDWDGSGRRDLRISNDVQYYDRDKGNEQLWQVTPGSAPRLYRADEGWPTVHIEGMGIATYDLDGDGRSEVYLTSQSASKLQALRASAAPGLPAYVDIGLARGVNVSHPYTGSDTDLPSTAWHPEFADVNDDGLVDLFVSKGNVTAQPDYAIEDPSNLLLGQPDGTFREAADVAGIVTFDRGRGAALVDLDLDGRLDLVEVFYEAPVRIWRNAGPVDTAVAAGAHWLAVRVQQPAPNVDAIGAWLEVRAGTTTWRRELSVGGGHAGGQLGWIHIGLGGATSAEARVRWPDGTVGPWQPMGVDSFAILDRSAGPQPWTPSAP